MKTTKAHYTAYRCAQRAIVLMFIGRPQEQDHITFEKAIDYAQSLDIPAKLKVGLGDHAEAIKLYRAVEREVTQ